MLNETNSELQERSDKAAADEMMLRTEEPQIPARIYTGELNDALDIVNAYFERQAVKQAIEDQQRIEAEEWNKHYYGY